MKLYRKLFSKNKEDKKENLENKGIATGSVMTGLGAASYGLGKLPLEYVDIHGIKKVNPIGANGARNLKVAGAILVPTGLSLAAASYYKKRKRKKGNDNKA